MIYNYFKLPFYFDPVLLAKDLAICEKEQWTNHFNKKDYNGSWKSISLRSFSGEENDIAAYAPLGAFKDTPLLRKCFYFSKIMDMFLCKKEAVRLLALAPKSEIKEHRDLLGGYEDGFFRIHIPVHTNEMVSFKVNGSEVPMKKGECWYADFNLPHSVKNNGEHARIHLVIDCIRNKWSDQLFSDVGYDIKKEPVKKEYTAEEKKQMIVNLKLMNTGVALQLAEKLEKET